MVTPPGQPHPWKSWRARDLVLRPIVSPRLARTNVKMAYPSAYPGPYPPPPGFNFVPENPNDGGYPGRPAVYPPYQPAYPRSVARNERENQPTAVPPYYGNNEVVPDVEFEQYPPNTSKKSAGSTSGINIENVEDSPDVSFDEEPSPNHPESQERFQLNTDKPLYMYFRDGRRRIDYVLAYEMCPDNTTEQRMALQEKRTSFEDNLKERGLEVEQEDFEASQNEKTVYVKIHAPWEVLANGAEEMLMKMPTTENENQTTGLVDKFFGCLRIRNPFEITVPVEPNYFTCAFKKNRIESFKGKDNKETFFTNSQRGQIVYRILKTTPYDSDGQRKIGISNSAYDAVFPLHEGSHEHNPDIDSSKQTDRQILYNVWAQFRRFYKKQPLNLIRKYFGEKIGIYFAWIGFYTVLLFPAAIFGLVNVIYGLARLSDYTPVNIICDESLKRNYTMCPRCDKCDYFPLYDTCGYARLAYVFDNELTVVFAVFMSLWSTMFLEFWKRRQVEIAYQWDVLGFEDEEENVRPEYDNVCGDSLRVNPITQAQEPYYPSAQRCPRFLCSTASVLLMIGLVVAAVFGVVVYRVAVFASLSAVYDGNISTISLTVTASAAFINLLIILLLSKVYQILAGELTKMELPRTQTNYDDSFTMKMYLFQFVNYYSSLFYIAFAKLNPGRPGDYHRIFGYRREECNAAGCLVELTIQLAIIMVGKQIINASLEIVVPKVLNWWNRRGNIKKFRNDGNETVDEHSMSDPKNQWESDYDLTSVPENALFYEYLEMVIQFGFITIFVAAFPLGPFFALLNNLVEIRLDAYKFITIFRRPKAARAEDIGIWYSILKAVVIFSVVVNGFVIAFVSEFVPRLYFKWNKGKDNSLQGYLDTSLSCFDINDFSEDEKPKFNFTDNFYSNGCGLNLETCRYRGYRDKPLKYNENLYNHTNAYDFSKDYWHILSGQLFFVITFLIVVFGLTALLTNLIPDRPKRLDNQIKREAYLAKNLLRVDPASV